MPGPEGAYNHPPGLQEIRACQNPSAKVSGSRFAHVVEVLSSVETLDP